VTSYGGGGKAAGRLGSRTPRRRQSGPHPQQKGHDYFVDAAHRIAAAEPRARFLLVGDGNQRQAVESRIDQLGLRERFVLAALCRRTPFPPSCRLWM